ncbi:MAG: IclR family transcriptional regulator, pca regulon regulatory protein [Rhodobacteraceae bacterium HLUCCA12]|nr:MAG: IclR family transcriptional regulator, pca regulon regulatory protein [Rhodobacteraceae bacterium HLUCCA12]
MTAARNGTSMNDGSETGDSGGDFVRSLARGLAVLKAFDQDSPAMTLSDVARKTGLSRASAGRFLKTLVALDYASFDGRDYRLRPRVLELGMAYFSSHSFVDIANPILKAAADKAQEPCSMAVLDGADIVYVVRHTANRMMSISITIGKRYPAHYTSLGWVLLGGLDDAERDRILAEAELRQVTPHTITDRDRLRAVIEQGRADGYCAAESQLETGILSIAVPVRDRIGTIIAAINMGVPASRHDRASLRRALLPILRDAAAEIEFALSKRL